MKTPGVDCTASDATVCGEENMKTYQVPPLYNKLFAYAKVFTFYLS